MDYIVNDTELTATADSIREKTGDTALLEWVTGKGFADVIAGIESGGGGLQASGTITFTNDTSCDGYIVEHNLGVEPKRFFWFIIDCATTQINPVSSKAQTLFLYTDQDCICTIGSTKNNYAEFIYERREPFNINILIYDENTIVLNDTMVMAAGYIPAGSTILWFAEG